MLQALAAAIAARIDSGQSFFGTAMPPAAYCAALDVL
jgi:hypothetical protein